MAVVKRKKGVIGILTGGGDVPELLAGVWGPVGMAGAGIWGLSGRANRGDVH